MILQKMKQTAEDYLGHKVEKAVITVPAYFNDSQRQATKDAGKIAGLDVLRIINEPTAAALAYGLDKKKDEKVAVFDLGGGTYDISVLELYDVEGSRQFEVKSTNGDTHLGGDDFDQRVIDWLVGGVQARPGRSTSRRTRWRSSASRKRLRRPRWSCRRTHVDGHQSAVHHRGPVGAQASATTTLTRAKFEQLVDDLIQRTLPPMEQALKDAGLKPTEIDEVLLVGGSTRIPKVQEIVKKFFGKEPNKGVNPDEVVAIGAAVQGAVLTGEQKDVLLLDVTPLSLGIETLGGVTTVLIPRNTTIPTQEVARRSRPPTTTRRRSRSTCCRASASWRVYNKTIGKFQLTGIPPAPRGMPQVEVTFDIDANGILHVSAKDKTTGKEQKIRIEASSGLSESRDRPDGQGRREERDRGQEAARGDRHAEPPRQHDVRGGEERQGMVRPAVSPSSSRKLDGAVERARKALRGEDQAEIRAAQEELTRAYSEAGQSLYQQQGAAAGRRRATVPPQEPSPRAPAPAAARPGASRRRGRSGLRDRRRKEIGPAAGRPYFRRGDACVARCPSVAVVGR